MNIEHIDNATKTTAGACNPLLPTPRDIVDQTIDTGSLGGLDNVSA